MSHLRQVFSPVPWFLILFLPFIALISPAVPFSVFAQDHSMHAMHAGMSMPKDDPMDPARQAKLLADKKESEFNHHLAGFFVMLAGLFILAETRGRQQSLLVRYAWPLCFLLSGLFVLIWSDTELWPFGPQSWYFGLTHHSEVLQHKVFAILLLLLGAIELQRARGVLKAVWSGWVFPAVSVVGSFMLFFHEHTAGMHGPDHMELMRRIQTQHLSYSVTGLGVGLAKGLSETNSAWRPFFESLFPTLLIVLGALLMVYVE